MTEVCGQWLVSKCASKIRTLNKNTTYQKIKLLNVFRPNAFTGSSPMLTLLAQKLSTVSLPLAVRAQGSLRYAPSLHCFATKTAKPTDQLALSTSRFAPLEANLSSKITGEVWSRSPPNLGKILQRAVAG
jgi:hypothetical protein